MKKENRNSNPELYESRATVHEARYIQRWLKEMNGENTAFTAEAEGHEGPIHLVHVPNPMWFTLIKHSSVWLACWAHTDKFLKVSEDEPIFFFFNLETEIQPLIQQ